MSFWMFHDVVRPLLTPKMRRNCFLEFVCFYKLLCHVLLCLKYHIFNEESFLKQLFTIEQSGMGIILLFFLFFRPI